MVVHIGALLLPVAISSALACQAQPCELTLTASNPSAVCPLPSAVVARPPLLVEIPVKKIVNPSALPFSIYVYLGGAKTSRELIGNVSVYPPDRTGVFVMRWRAPHNAQSGKQITVEIKRTLESQPWREISVTIGPLRWLYEEPKP